MISQDQNVKSSYRFILVFLLFVVLYGVWEFYLRKDVARNGIYLKCQIQEVLPYKGGVRVQIAYSFRSKQYQTLINYSGNRIEVGDQYFIKVAADNPGSVLFLDSVVPKCLLEMEMPKEGWKSLPTCN